MDSLLVASKNPTQSLDSFLSLLYNEFVEAFRADPLFSPRTNSFRISGMSFAEMMVVMGVLAVLVFVLILGIQNVVPTAQRTTAENNLNQLNAAVLRFNQSNWELVLTPISSGDDETAIFQSLQYRHPSHPAPGSPYLSSTSVLAISSDETMYRALWNGRLFEILPPGTSGVGVDLARMSEQGAEATFATNYTPVGTH